MINDKNQYINILGINLLNCEKQEILDKIKDFLTEKKQYQITTPNPEFVLEAHRDEEFFYILNNADLSIPDGFGLKLASWLMGDNIRIIHGADLVKDIFDIAEKDGKKIAVINWSGGLSSAEEIKTALQKKWPKADVLVEDIERGDGNIDWQKINSFSPDIVFSSLGYPYQEKFIYHNLKNIPSAKIGMGVGGSFDFLTGKRKRAPKIMRIMSLEWLWRVIIQPSRWRRIYNAVFVFLYEFIKWEFINPFFYRKNVACLLFKKDQDVYRILIVERKIEKEHWQLPQGGTEGENIITAGERELKEELGTDKFKTINFYKKLHKYDFNGIMSKFKVTAKEYTGYKGQKQGLVIAEFLGKDEDIKINFWEHEKWKWILADKLVEEVHEVRKKSAKIFLEKFKETIKNYEK